MRIAVLLVFTACSFAVGSDWVPSDNPDPYKILDQAVSDAHRGDFEDALKKHVWFFENVLTYEPHSHGVRLSAGLSDWKELADQYPPALEKLKEVRDQAKQNLLEGKLEDKDVFGAFHDMESINEKLGEEHLTVEVFKELDQKAPQAGNRVFPVAQDSLVQAKEYLLLGKYVSPERDLMVMKITFRHTKEYAKKHSEERWRKYYYQYANSSYVFETSRLVAILAVNKREKEAEVIAKSAREEWIDAKFHNTLKLALQGVFPDPNP